LLWLSFRIACISCPTAYRKLRELDPSDRSIICLEYDERFQMFGPDFVRYDYNNPLDLPADFDKAFDMILCDPPFLSEECLRKVATTVQFMAAGAVLLCTGSCYCVNVLVLCSSLCRWFTFSRIKSLTIVIFPPFVSENSKSSFQIRLIFFVA